MPIIRRTILLFLIVTVLLSAIACVNNSMPSKEKETVKPNLSNSETNDTIDENTDYLYRSMVLSLPLPSQKHEAIEAFNSSPLTKGQILSDIAHSKSGDILLGSMDIKASEKEDSKEERFWRYNTTSDELIEEPWGLEDVITTDENQKEYVMNNVVSPFVNNKMVTVNSVNNYLSSISSEQFNLGYVAAYQKYYVLMAFNNSPDQYYLYVDYNDNLLEIEKYTFNKELQKYVFVEVIHNN